MSEAKKGRYPAHLNTPEVFKKLSIARAGKKASPETIKKLSESHRGIPLSD